MRRCSRCERTSESHRIIKSKEYGMLCDRCYQREKNNPITYKLPEYGEVTYSPDNKPICHICGKAFNKILSHARQVHKVSAREYKETYGLDVKKGIMSPKSTSLARQRVYENYDVSIENNLLDRGKKSRYKEGHKGRTKDQVSEQTRRRLVKQLRINDSSKENGK